MTAYELRISDWSSDVYSSDLDATGEIYPTNVACKLLDRDSCRCTHYRGRKAFVPDCVRLTADKVGALSWLPSTCAYRLRAAGEPLPEWHYLVSGDRESVHAAGMRSEARRVGKEGLSTVRTRWSPYP